VISPDGRWLAYGADNTGRSEVYVRPYPDAAAGQWQISNSGAKTPLWSRDGKELFYFAADGALMAVPVESTSTAWNAGPPVRLLAPLYDQGIAAAGRTYDISADGKRFLMIKAPEAAAASRTELVVVLHFDEELKRVAGVK
jgi:serine/threonine-protein kinase